jgi:hypothetical protein
MKVQLLALSIIAIIFVSCKKDNEPTRIDYLTKGEWKYLPIGYDSDKNGKADYNSIPHCLLDNEIEFYKNGTGVEDENLTSCPIQDPRFSNFEWVLSDDQKKLKLTGDTSVNILGEFNIQLLNNTHLSLQTEYFNSNTQQIEWLIYNFVRD